MDTRTGNLYPDQEAALEDGVPSESIENVEVVTVESGPFKGRRYVRNADGSLGRRVVDTPRPRVLTAIEQEQEDKYGPGGHR